MFIFYVRLFCLGKVCIEPKYKCNDFCTQNNVPNTTGTFMTSFLFLDCGPPLDVDNGTAYYTSMTEGATAQYECDSGYRIVGSALVTCLPTGKWTQEPVCAGGEAGLC